jgi:hypothetical protein
MLLTMLSRFLSRRKFLATGGAAGLAGLPVASSLLSPRKAAADPAGDPPLACTDMNALRESYWSPDGAYFVQQNVDASRLDQGVISARVDGRWQDFEVRTVTKEFLEWNFGKRAAMLNVMMTGQYDLYNDIHSAAVATYGANRGDSRLTVNVAYKGTGWIPRPSLIKDKIKQYADTYNASDMTKFQILSDGYKNKEMWRRDVLGSHDLYTTRDFESHTFLNQMVNPIAALCFLDMISYEIRAVVRLLHPKDPDLTDEERDLVTWVNYAHDWFHGTAGGGPLTAHRIVALYYVVELFDNSPWGQTDLSGGHRVVPPM